MKVIGTITTVQSQEHPYLAHLEVRVVAVIKGAAAPDLDPEADCPIATTDEELAALGGIDANDRAEVQPWLPEKNRWSFVSSDPRVTDLAAWSLLAPRKP